MPNSRQLCILVAEIVGGDRLAARIGEEEIARAVERCLNRVDLAIGTSGGEIVARNRSVITATFEKCDNGVMAACEAIDRVRKLPPVSGAQTQLRVGVHYGEIENGIGEGLGGARLILQACDADQSLASSLVVDRLNPVVKKLTSAKPHHNDALSHRLPWPVFTISSQNAAITSTVLSRPSYQSPEFSTPPATPFPITQPPATPFPITQPSTAQSSATPAPVAQPPTTQSPATQPSTASLLPTPRMLLKHQQNILVIDRNRPVVLLGRELGNDIVIIDPRASRQHARIERRREGFVLIDASTNGCFVAIEGQKEQCLKEDELLLTSAGRFGCGFSSKEFEDDLVFFEIVQADH